MSNLWIISAEVSKKRLVGTMAKIRNLHSAKRGKLRNLMLALALFAATAVGLNYLIAKNNHTDEYLVATHDMAAGTAIGVADLKVIQVNLAESANQYIAAADKPSAAYLLGPVRAGQLISRSMLANSIIDERVPIVVTPAMSVPESMIAGSSVDLWVTPVIENNSFGEPFALVMGAEVAARVENKEMFASETPKIELWVPLEAVSPVLSSIARGDSISLILRPTLAD
ncbi:MAG: SAF domain-containing protein [Rhodoluna sp.]